MANTNYRWRGSVSTAFGLAGNWAQDNGNAHSVNVSDGDILIFDATPTRELAGSDPDITVQSIRIGEDFDGSIADTTTPLTIGAQEVLIDGEAIGTDGINLRTWADPDRTVRKDGTGTDTTIQDAIDNASATNVIHVYEDSWAATTYSESIDITKELTIRAIGNVTISGDGTDSVVETNGTVTTASILEGFTITHTSSFAGAGGGINVANGDGLTVRRCTIQNIEITGANDGAGIYADGNLIIEDCTISGCTSAQNGGGIYLDGNAGAASQIVRCTISGNAAADGGGIYIDAVADGWDVINCLIYENTASDDGAGAFLKGATTVSSIVQNCTFADNVATADGGGIYTEGGMDCLIRNCLMWNDLDTTSNDNEIYLNDAGDAPTVTNCNLEGDLAGIEGAGSEVDGGNNINSDPVFNDDTNDDYSIDESSPCLDAGTNTGAPDRDIDHKVRDTTSGTADIGAYEWGDSTTAAFEMASGDYYHTFGTVVISGKNEDVATTPTTTIQGEIGTMQVQRGLVTLTKYSAVTTDLTVSFKTLTGVLGDAELTLQSTSATSEGVYPSSTVKVLGGTVTCDSTMNVVEIDAPKGTEWTQQSDRNVTTLDLRGGTFIWKSGDITTCTVQNAELDGSQSVEARTVTTLNGYNDSRLVLNDGVGSITVTNAMQVWGAGLEVAPGSTLTIA